MQKTRKDFLELKDMRDSVRQQISEWGWDDKYCRFDLPHKDCRKTPRGAWKIMAFGTYLAADYYWRRYVSYRCPSCGWMIQVTQPFDIDSDAVGTITVLEVHP